VRKKVGGAVRGSSRNQRPFDGFSIITDHPAGDRAGSRQAEKNAFDTISGLECEV
jgi:hypothetical protein